MTSTETPPEDTVLGQCENCSKPILLGMPFFPYDDIDGLHLDCDNPYRLPKENEDFGKDSPDPIIYLGSPMLCRIPAPVARSSAATASDLARAAAADKVASLLGVMTETCDRYANFIRNFVSSRDVEMHPYLPGLEGEIEDARQALAEYEQATNG